MMVLVMLTVMENKRKKKKTNHHQSLSRPNSCGRRLERIWPNLRSKRLQSILTFAIENEQRKVREETSQFHMECDILYSNANYKAKKTTFILFINGRWCECSQLKRAIEIRVYQSVFTILVARKTFRIFEHETSVQRRGRERAPDEKRGALFAPRGNRRTRADSFREGVGKK